MKQLTIAFCASLLLAACGQDKKTDEQPMVASATTEVKDKTDDWVPVDSATAEKAWMEYMATGPQHAMLAKANGQWTADITMWMAEGAPPMKTTGTATNKMILGGRYQQSTNKAMFMNMPFEGISTVGYDNAKKVFAYSWIDNMGTGIMNMEGTLDEATKTISFKGKMIHPANGKECNVRETFKFVDDNTQTAEMYGPDPKTGKEFKNMEIRFTRRK